MLNVFHHGKHNLTIVRAVTMLTMITFSSYNKSIGEEKSELLDSQIFKRGEYTAFIAPYNKGRMRQGIDYHESITYQPTNFPSSTLFRWQWPPLKTSSNAEVKSFIAIDYGDYLRTRPIAQIKSSKISDIDVLSVAQNSDANGDLTDFNVIIDFFLTAESHSPVTQYEVEFFVHASDAAMNFRSHLPKLGSFIDNYGNRFSIYRDAKGAQGTDFLLFADGYPASIDVAKALRELQHIGALRGSEYFNGMAFGVEPIYGHGSLFVRNISIIYKVI